MLSNDVLKGRMRRKRGGERDHISEGEGDTVKNMIPRSYKENVALKLCSGHIDLPI